MTRGERNNNPLNIRRVSGTHWRGEVTSPIRDKDFVEFCGLEYGIRAAFCILRTYRDKCKAVCVEDIIRRWAPPSENNTERYIRRICLWTGFGGRQRLTEADWPKLIKAMARQECSLNLSDDVIQRAFELYKGNGK